MKRFFLIAGLFCVGCPAPPVVADAGADAGGGGAGGGGGSCSAVCPAAACSTDLQCSDPGSDCRGVFCGGTCNPPGCPCHADCGCFVCAADARGSEGSPCASDNDCRDAYACAASTCRLRCAGAADCAGRPCNGGRCDEPPLYGACLYAGGLDRLRIGRFDPRTQTCAVVQLVGPGFYDGGLSLPPGWGLDSVSVGPTDGGCPGAFPGFTGAPATAALGSIELDGGEVNVHLRVAFDGGDVLLAANRIAQCR